MTEEELTQAAILKAQALKREEKTPISSNKPEVAVKNKPAQKPSIEPIMENLEEDLRENSSKFPHSVVIGNNKTVNFKTWTGKTKKQINNIVGEAIEDPDFDELLEVLIRENIEQPDMYFTDLEEQYLLLMIRGESLSKELEFTSYCPLCDHAENIKTTITSALKFKPSDFPQTNEELGLKFIDIESRSDLLGKVKEYMNSSDYDGITTETDIEIAMHIQKGDMNYLQILDWLDTSDLKTITEITETLSKLSADYEISTNKVCSNCKKKVDFKTNDLPNVFDDLL